AAIAQLVVHFMPDPVAGLAEMRRVTRPGGSVAACVWDFAGERAPLSLFWRAARDLDPSVVDESAFAGARQGHLVELLTAAGCTDVNQMTVDASREHASFEEWWEPYTAGVGPAGTYVAGLSADRQEALRERCRALLPPAPFTITAKAWAVRGSA
ncbi:MAG TPA: SAM-dependent methyltransferase, partial [Candidatus Limnocylindria bacterium]|nr:SAM-dependent methyltransferase [Candidatus Limnocylindria bacterium]